MEWIIIILVILIIVAFVLYFVIIRQSMTLVVLKPGTNTAPTITDCTRFNASSANYGSPGGPICPQGSVLNSTRGMCTNFQTGQDTGLPTCPAGTDYFGFTCYSTACPAGYTRTDSCTCTRNASN